MKELTKKRLANHRVMPASRFHMANELGGKKGKFVTMADGQRYEVINDAGTLRRVRAVENGRS